MVIYFTIRTILNVLVFMALAAFLRDTEDHEMFRTSSTGWSFLFMTADVAFLVVYFIVKAVVR